MRKRVLFLLAVHAVFFATALIRTLHSAPAVPFGAHSFPYSSLVITPTSQTRAQMDTVVQNFYTTWKASYVVGGCVAGRRRINYDGGNQTVSEAHGYGMLAAVLMAGYDSDAQAMFDDFYRYFRAHNATGAGGADLMAWQQDASCANINGPDSASDGDLDIAMALLMADRQWGSCGAIDYRTEGLKVVNAIKAGETDATHAYIKLGNWVLAGDATYYPSTRSSDFLLSHYRSFKWASGDTAWDTVLNTTYSIIGSLQTNYSASTGLLPDFIKNPLGSPAPVPQGPPTFLEDDVTDGNLGYNACRDPWRITTDLAASGDPRAQAAMQKIKAFIKTSSGSNAANLKSERYLNGSVIGNYEDLAFSAPYMVCAMSDPGDQAWMNALWTRVSTQPSQDYFGDSIKLLSMIVATGNWWQPEYYGNPCAIGTPTFTPTRTGTRTVTPTGTVTVPAATATSSPTPTSTRSQTATFTGTATRSATATSSRTALAATPTSSATPSVTATPTATATRSRTLTSSPTSTQSPSSTLSFSASPSPAGTLTDTPTVTLSATPSASASGTPSATPSATASLSPSATLSFSASPSPAGTLTDTPTLSPGASATVTFSATAPNSATPTLTVSATRTATASQPSATPSPTPQATQTSVNGSCRNVLAYYTSWSKPAYSAADIPYGKLTHICHAFLLPNADGSLPVPAGFLEAGLIPNAHSHGVKVLVSVGGASGSANIGTLASTPSLRATFASNVKAFLLANSYDGVDIDWEFPQSATDKNNLTALVQALRAEFNASPNAHPEWLISGAYSQTTYYGQYYDLTALTPLVDFFNLMTYDYYGPWSSRSGHNAPLYPATGDPSGNSAMGSLNYFINTRGVPPAKINFGLAFYGYDFPTEALNGNCPTCGTDTNTDAYKTILALIGHGWTRVWDASASSPYLTNDTDARVISYDDPQSIQAKADYALNARGLAGVFMWDLSMDAIGGGQQPLLDAMRNALLCGPTYTPSPTPTPITFNVPGRIQAEDYTASYDTTAGNSGGLYHADDVDIEATGDLGGGYDIGWTAAGEWLDYSVVASYSGSFDLTFRIASDQAGPLTLGLDLDGSTLLAGVNLPTTGGWQAWTDVTVPNISLPAGAHTLRLRFITGGMNVNYIDVKVPSNSTSTITPTVSATPSITPTPSATATVPSATPSPTAGDGPLLISRCVAGPNPNPTHLYVEMQGPADELEFKLYDRAMRCVLEGKQPSLAKGWNAVALPPELRFAGNGTYFYRVTCRRAAIQGKPVLGRLALLR